MTRADLPAVLLSRKAVVYVRQSSTNQVLTHRESQHRQYALTEVARGHGFRDLEVIDDDLGRTASGTTERPGFERLLTLLYDGQVGAVLCLDATRLARNGRDWEHLLEVCGFVDARIIDPRQVYDPNRPNDRLLLGLQGTLATFELSQLRQRMAEAARAKARRGEMRMAVPVGFVWERGAAPDFDPDARLQATIREVFARFRRLGSARQVLLSMTRDGFHLPRPSGHRRGADFDWRPIRYHHVKSILSHPFYAGAYAYGRTGPRTATVDGRLRRSYGHPKPQEAWEVLIKDHHPGYIVWEEFMRNRRQMAANAYGQGGGPKSGRGGRALLAGLCACARCGRRLQVSYSGPGSAVYTCRRGEDDGRGRCLSFGARGVEAAVVVEVLRAVSPLAVDAAREAERKAMEEEREGQRLLELALEQARYEASLAERRYAACDPDNRLIAARLETIWEQAEQRVAAVEARLAEAPAPRPAAAGDFTALADDLERAWHAPGTTMRARQQLLRSVIETIIAEADEAAQEIALVIHWRGGRHSRLRVRRRTGGRPARTPDAATRVIASMAGHWPDTAMAATLNRMGIRTGKGNTWNARRVAHVRTTRRLDRTPAGEGTTAWLTMAQAAGKLHVSRHRIRRLIDDGILAATQAAPHAPWRIQLSDLADPKVRDACRSHTGPTGRAGDDRQLPMELPMA